MAIEVLDGLDHYLLRRPRETIEALAAGIITMLSRLANRNIAAREVAFRHQKPASTAEHARIEAK